MLNLVQNLRKVNVTLVATWNMHIYENEEQAAALPVKCFMNLSFRVESLGKLSEERRKKM